MRKLISQFTNKCLSVFDLGKAWFSRLLGSLADAARSISYVETVNSSQSDTLHKRLKGIDFLTLKRAFEECTRRALQALRLGPVKVAIDATEDPYWGKHGSYNTRAKVHQKSDESWQFVNLAIVEPKFIPLMSVPYRQIDDLDSLVIELLKYLKSLPLRVTLVLFDRGFYHSHLIDYLQGKRRGWRWPYIILAPKNEAIKKYVEQTQKIKVFKHQMLHSKSKSTWKPTTKIVVCKGVGKNKEGRPIDWCFATNQRGSTSLVWEYRKRWNIETGFRVHDEARIKSKSSNPVIRFFYHLVGMLFILMWRLQNKCSYYIVFKRYLKKVEMHFFCECGG